MITESEWLASSDPKSMFPVIRRRSSRKLRLWACGFSRWFDQPQLTHELIQAIDAAERLADGFDSKERRAIGRDQFVCMSSARDAAEGMLWSVSTCADHSRKEAAKALAAELFRCVFGNPFRSVSVNPAWLTPTVRGLATATYSDRRPDDGSLDPNRLAILADALEEAGCTEQTILDHLRGPGPHVRGCFAVDLLRPDYR